MHLLIVPDIFGVTPALSQLAQDLGAALAARPEPFPLAGIRILDPFGNGLFFEDEARAYAHFSAHLGVQAYAASLREHVGETGSDIILLGFSAGASAIWHLAGTGPCPGVRGAIGFYGSQIRHFTHLDPVFPIHLIFPCQESHFEVGELIRTLAPKPRVFCQKAPGGHGFMNALSANFDRVLYRQYVRDILPERLTAL